MQTLEQLTEKIVEDVEFYEDMYDRFAIFAEFKNNADTTFFENIDNEHFHSYLRIKALSIAPKFGTFNAEKAVTYIRDLFNMGTPIDSVETFVRTSGGLEDGIVYDLIDKKQQVVIINENGWEVTSEKPCKFLSSSTSLPQVMPEKTDEDIRDLLKPFFNLDADNFVIAVLWLIQGFCNSKHYGLIVMAERGSGKSMLSRLFYSILDPSRLDVTALSTKRDDLVTTLSNTCLVCFDNVDLNGMSKEISDLLCTAMTGGTASKRTLYSNNGLTIQKLKNNIVINGINVVPKEADLAERFLLINLKKLTQDQIVCEQELNKAFNKAKPKILGAIFNTLSKAMKIRSNLNVKNPSRMADAFSDMLCIALALGYTESDFRNIINQNKEKMKVARCHKPLIEAVREYMTTVSGRKAEGTVSDIYSRVKLNYSGSAKLLPNSPSRFSRELELERDTLLAIGYRVNLDDTHSKGTWLQIIKTK